MIKIGVIGAGNMGKNHIRCINDLKNDFELVGFTDKLESNIKFVEEKYGIKYFENIEDAIQNQNVTFSRFVIQACEYALNNLEKSDKN